MLKYSDFLADIDVQIALKTVMVHVMLRWVGIQQNQRMKNKAPSANEGFFNKVYEAVKRVPRGKVTTYGDDDAPVQDAVLKHRALGGPA